MADKIVIVGGAPTVNLGIKSYTEDLASAELTTWSTFDDAAFTITQSRITAVAARRGAGLLKSGDSTGPVRELREGKAVGKFTNGQLNYLYSPVLVDSASFSMAAVVYVDTYTSATRDLMAVFESGNGLRIWRSAGRYAIRTGAVDILEIPQVFNQSGFHLIIFSQFNGQAALLVKRIGSDLVTARIANTVTLGASCTPVFGADEIANGAVGAAPAANRSWQDCIAEAMVWRGVDILAPGNLVTRDKLVSYFDNVYGAAA